MARHPSPHSLSSGRDEKNVAVPWYKRKRNLVVIIVLSLLILLALGLGLGLGLRDDAPSYHHEGSNVIVIMTDDQDLRLDSMSAMPKVNRLIGEQGVTYDKHYCTVAICCPSRVNFLTGKAAHNTNVTSLSPPYGGWPKFNEQKLNDNYLPVWIQDAGIRTYYIGKFMNSFGVKNMASPKRPQGWTDSSFLVDPYTYNYWESGWTKGESDQILRYKGQHTTKVTEDKALAMIDDAADSGDQFFMMVAPVAPHQGGSGPPPLPPKYANAFSDRKAPRSQNFNPDTPSGASWVKKLPKLDAGDLEVCDKTFYHRLANIARVDDMVAEMIQRLEERGILDNTYIMYTSDNGFHIGNHRLKPGKRCPYEEDINVPLLVRGPDVAKGMQSHRANSHTDVAPTILQMLGVPLRDDFDGAPIVYTEEALSNSNPTKQDLVNVEFWNMLDNGQGPIGYANNGLYDNNTYKALRLMHDDQSFFYSVWCTGEHELYDMKTDPYQMSNQIGVPHQYFGRRQAMLIDRLDAILMVSKSCKQDSCRDPWGVLFPGGQVTNLGEAMSAKYDTFFARQPKVSFDGCPDGYIVAREGPMAVNVFSK